MSKLPKYIDIHAHINFPQYNEDRDEVISRTIQNDTWIINVGTGEKTSKEVIELAEKNEGMFAIIGIHPIHSDEEEFNEELFEELIKHPKVVGIGECGLDFFHMKEDSEKVVQEEIFRKQIELAVRHDKPIMIHCRDAYSEVIEILKEYKEKHGDKFRGNFHFFAGTKDEAKEILDLGFTVSFTGVITFAKEYEELVKMVPIEKMMSETDCPYVAPVPYRGKRNEPIYVKEVVKKIAEIKKLPEEEVSEKLLKNATNFFGLL